MINIFIGYDKKETVAYHVLCHSILRRSTVPVSITPLNRDTLKGYFWRPRGEFDSTDFSNSRFIVPALMDYKGWAIFMDCDMLCLDDINNLWRQRDDRATVMVRKNVHDGTEGTKFLGQEQTSYKKKNWSSLMMFNCEKCTALTKNQVNTGMGLWLHRFEWCDEKDVMEIEGDWNHLIGVYPNTPKASLLHWTLGGPWHGHEDRYSGVWWLEYENMLQGSNPVDYRGKCG